MTLSISWAMMLRLTKSGLSKILRKMRSVRICWMIISSTAASARLGLRAWRQRVAKSSKAWMKSGLVRYSFPDQGQEGGGVLRQLILELVDRGLPFLKMGRLIVEEGFEGRNELFRLGDILVEIFPAILVDDGPMGGLKEDVVFGIARPRISSESLFPGRLWCPWPPNSRGGF